MAYLPEEKSRYYLKISERHADNVWYVMRRRKWWFDKMIAFFNDADGKKMAEARIKLLKEYNEYI